MYACMYVYTIEGVRKVRFLPRNEPERCMLTVYIYIYVYTYIYAFTYIYICIYIYVCFLPRNERERCILKETYIYGKRDLFFCQKRSKQYIYTMSTCKALHNAFLPVEASTVGYLHEEAVRLLFHAATVKTSGNVDYDGIIGRALEDHRIGFRWGEHLPAVPDQTGTPPGLCLQRRWSVGWAWP